MSRPFKLGLITAAIIAVVAVVVDVVAGGRNPLAELGFGLIVFAIVFLIAFIIFRVIGGKGGRDEYEYEDD